jgi:hypothetical protein
VSGTSSPASHTAAPSPGALRMARYRRRKQRRMRWIGIELREAEIDVLIRRGWLSAGDREDPLALRKALYLFLDDHLR